MARNYGKIEMGFWQNPDIRALTEDARYLFLYLCSSPHSTAASAYRLPMNYAIEDLGWTRERVTEGFRQLSLKPHALYDERSQVAYLPGWWEHNKPENPNVAEYAAKLLLALPNCQLKAHAINKMREAVKYTDALYKVLGEWSWEPSQEPLPLRLPELSPKPLPGLFRPEPNLTQPEPNPTQQDARSRGKRAKAPKTKLPPDWQPSDADRAYARDRGLTEAEIDAEARAFARYWTSDDAVKGGLKADWPRTWCNRIDEVADRVIGRRPRPNNGHGGYAEGQPSAGSQRNDVTLWRLRFEGLALRKVWSEPAYGCKPPDLSQPWQPGMPEVWRELLPWKTSQGPPAPEAA